MIHTIKSKGRNHLESLFNSLTPNITFNPVSRLHNRILPLVITDFLPELRSVTVILGVGAGGLRKAVDLSSMLVLSYAGLSKLVAPVLF